MGEIFGSLISGLILLLIGIFFGGRREREKTKQKEKEQADAFEDAIEGSHSGGAAWLDRLRDTDPVQRGRPKGGRTEGGTDVES